jgi:uncharacterized Zn finger protein
MEEPVSLETLLAEFDQKQLQGLLVTLAERYPDLTDDITTQALLLRHQPAADAPVAQGPPAPPDLALIRRMVRAPLRALNRLRPSEWNVGRAVDEVRPVLQKVHPFLEAGDGRSALVALEAITQEYLTGWTQLGDPDGEVSSFLLDLGPLWTEAILSADLTPAEREAWIERFAGWQEELQYYGGTDAFDAATAAAREGWDDPHLRRILEGRIRRAEADETQPSWSAAAVAVARLKVLERQGRFEEYLNLAREDGQDVPYVTMLARLGHIPDAVEYARNYLTTAAEALAAAKAISAHGASEEAMRLAEQTLEWAQEEPNATRWLRYRASGLELFGGRPALARWLRDQAHAGGQTERALRAALIVMDEQPTLADYQATESIAGDRWPGLRIELLSQLRARRSHYPQAEVEIFLREGRLDDAIATVDDADHYGVVEKVVDAAGSSRPDWAIRACRHQAEVIINRGRSNHYHHAVRWLEKARDVFLNAGREAEWLAYLEQLLRQYQRKYSLVPLLEELRYPGG